MEGIDGSPELIGIARERCALLRGCFHLQDVRDRLPGSFDAIFNVFTSIGFTSEADDILIFSNIKDALRTNGRFLLDFARSKYLSSSDYLGETSILPGVSQIRIREGKRIRLIWKRPHSQLEISWQAYDENRICDLLATVGLRVTARWGNLFRVPLTAEAKHATILAVKRDDHFERNQKCTTAMSKQQAHQPKDLQKIPGIAQDSN